MRFEQEEQPPTRGAAYTNERSGFKVRTREIRARGAGFKGERFEQEERVSKERVPTRGAALKAVDAISTWKCGKTLAHVLLSPSADRGAMRLGYWYSLVPPAFASLAPLSQTTAHWVQDFSRSRKTLIIPQKSLFSKKRSLSKTLFSKKCKQKNATLKLPITMIV